MYPPAAHCSCNTHAVRTYHWQHTFPTLRHLLAPTTGRSCTFATQLVGVYRVTCSTKTVSNYHQQGMLFATQSIQWIPLQHVVPATQDLLYVQSIRTGTLQLITCQYTRCVIYQHMSSHQHTCPHNVLILKLHVSICRTSDLLCLSG